MATRVVMVEPERFYHVYNRAVGKESMFRSRTDYLEFMNRMKEFVLPVAEIHAFILLPNHFHFMLKFFNRKNDRKGGLMQRPFGRKAVKDDGQLTWLLWYIHRNPMHHHITNQWETYPYSSYPHYFQESSEFVTTSYMLEYFGGLANLKAHHQQHAEAFATVFSPYRRVIYPSGTHRVPVG
jgi:putative transposase